VWTVTQAAWKLAELDSRLPPEKALAMKTKGLHAYRFKNNPLERKYALAWEVQNREGKTLAYLLDPDPLHPLDPSNRDQEVAATVIQWLGSPVGQAFLGSLNELAARSKGAKK
jgi:hypothetical protein